ncbi:beta-ketoacyl synthase N-terminal-like domain-containing protein [Saccharopolyspora sp. MS10]|uniref:beta-ketoacyl synthase N-terminal-like domain-containing protein n=1 Tax=Saccharopolyspora sp. MS10 TaxID=3385973 RepID=UPI0039A1A577
MSISPWLAHAPQPHASLHLLCFGYSGAGPGVFKDWRIPGVDVLPIQLPGRGPRAEEPLATTLGELADDIAHHAIPHLTAPFVLLGHSMGAWLAHAVVTRLPRDSGLARLIVISAPPPHLRHRRFSSLHTLSDTDMADEVIRLGGAPEHARDAVANNINVIRTDATAVAGYRPDERLLPCPITVISGEQEPLFGPGDLMSWRELTHEPVTMRFTAGGHFTVTDARDEIIGHVAADAGATTLHPEPIAITGMACRFPGAPNYTEFWELLANGRDAIRPIPPDRPNDPFSPVMRVGGFIDDVDKFDAAHFGFSPREAHRSDPRLRLLLMTAQEALDDAALTPQDIAGPRTGVWIGESHSDYWDLSTTTVPPNMYTLSGGGLKAFLSGRLSHTFDFQGPSLTLDTSCSASLTAIHTAAQSLRTGEVDTALAGGAHLILNPDAGPSLGLSKAISPRGRSAFASTDADGYARAEGIACLVLKRLPDAIDAGDPIHAVIDGSALNANGQSGRNIVATSAPGQIRMMRQALTESGLRPEAVGYVEAHGPGTQVGDAIELEALHEVYGSNPNTCYVGSVKTNIGHLEPCAGIAGLIKTVLALQHGRIPESLHHTSPSPVLDWDTSALKVPTSLVHWPRRGTRAAAVSSFGLSGSNAHALLSEAPRQHHHRPRLPRRSWNLRRYWYTEVA